MPEVPGVAVHDHHHRLRHGGVDLPSGSTTAARQRALARDDGGLRRVDVDAAREMLAVTEQHQRAQRGVVFVLVEGFGQPQARRRVEPVLDEGPVEADERDLTSAFDGDRRGSAARRRGLSLPAARRLRANTPRPRSQRRRSTRHGGVRRLFAGSSSLSSFAPAKTIGTGGDAPSGRHRRPGVSLGSPSAAPTRPWGTGSVGPLTDPGPGLLQHRVGQGPVVDRPGENHRPDHGRPAADGRTPSDHGVRVGHRRAHAIELGPQARCEGGARLRRLMSGVRGQPGHRAARGRRLAMARRQVAVNEGRQVELEVPNPAGARGPGFRRRDRPWSRR